MAKLNEPWIIFGEPYVDAFVPLFNRGQRIGENDIAKIKVSNRPRIGEAGASLTNCYGSITFYEGIAPLIPAQSKET